MQKKDDHQVTKYYLVNCITVTNTNTGCLNTEVRGLIYSKLHKHSLQIVFSVPLWQDRLPRLPTVVLLSLLSLQAPQHCILWCPYRVLSKRDEECSYSHFTSSGLFWDAKADENYHPYSKMNTWNSRRP